MTVAAIAVADVREEPPLDPRVVAAIAGDRLAMEELFLELLPRVRNLVRYLTRGDDDVDDIAQEAFVVVIRRLETFRGEGPFTAWVDRIVARKTFLEIRRRRAERADVRPVAVESCLDPAPTDAFISRRRLAEQLDVLPVEQRYALVLHHVVGMSAAEIAGEFGVPAETIRSRLRLAKARLLEIEATSSRE